MEDAKRFVAFNLLEASGRLGSYAAAAYSEYLRMMGPGKGGSYKYISYIWDLPFPGGQGEETVCCNTTLFPVNRISICLECRT